MAELDSKDVFVGMKMSLPMEWDTSGLDHKPKIEKATCISIPRHRRFAVFEFRNGLKMTVPLTDTERLASNAATPVPQPTPKEREAMNSNCARVMEELKISGVTAAAASMRSKKASGYLDRQLASGNMSNQDMKHWIRIIESIAQERRDENSEVSPTRMIQKALQDTGLNGREASRLCGKSQGWLAGVICQGSAQSKRSAAKMIYAAAQKQLEDKK